MINYILIAILALIVGGIVYYLYREKKRGVTCIGCPHAGKCGGGCSCSHENAKDPADNKK